MTSLKELSKEDFRALLGSLSRVEICDRYGVSESTLSRLIRRHGLARQGYYPYKLTEDQEVEIVRLYFREGLTQGEIGVRFGVSQSMVSRIINNHSDGVNFRGEASVKVSYKYNAN